MYCVLQNLSMQFSINDELFYMMKTETTRAAMRLPKVMLSCEEAPVNSVEPVGAAVPLDGTTVAKVVAAGVAAAGISLVMIPAGTEAGAGVPTTRAADEDPAGVSKTT